MKRRRADVMLVEQGLCESRSQAQRLIMAGQVRVGADYVVGKPSEQLPADSELQLVQACPYVSRGAFKLLGALDSFAPDLSGVVGLDVGASTGGFTDVMLQRGARRVYAVDVGYGQLHLKLREDPRVVCLERTNARYLDSDAVPEPIDIMTADVSFISLTLILPPCIELLRPGGHCFTLIKPQFEAGAEQVGKGGVVRDEAVRQECVDKIRAFAETTCGLTCLGVVPSPIKGPKGNQEFTAAFRKGRRTEGLED